MEEHRFAVYDEGEKRGRRPRESSYRLDVWDKGKGELGSHFTHKPDTRHRAAQLCRLFAAGPNVAIRVFTELDVSADGFLPPENELRDLE